MDNEKENPGFFIEPPGDRCGNRGMPRAVMSGTLEGRSIKLTGPPEITDKWPSVNIAFVVPVSSEAGPARPVDTTEELDALLEEHRLWTPMERREYEINQLKAEGYGK